MPVTLDRTHPVVVLLLALLAASIVLFTALSTRDVWAWPSSWLPDRYFFKVWLGSLCAMFVFLGAAFFADKVVDGAAEAKVEAWQSHVKSLTAEYQAAFASAYGVTINEAHLAYPEVGESRTVTVTFPDGDVQECTLHRDTSEDDVVDTLACDRPLPHLPPTETP